MDPLRTCSKPGYFDLILTILDPFWGSWREAAARPLRAAFGLEDLFGASQTMPGTSNFGHFDHFSYWKGQFLSFCLRGQWKCHFDPILSPPEPNFLALAKMCLFVPFARMDLGGTLRDPKLTLILTILDPFWGSLEEVAARPLRDAFVMRHFEQFMVLVKAKYFWYVTFRFSVVSMALQRFSFMNILRIFVNIDKYCVVALLRPSIFDAYRLFAYFSKESVQKSPCFFTFSKHSVMRPSIDLGRSAHASF